MIERELTRLLTVGIQLLDLSLNSGILFNGRFLSGDGAALNCSADARALEYLTQYEFGK